MTQPFHMSIIDRLNASHSPASLIPLGDMIVVTDIPAGHELDVRDAWTTAVNRIAGIGTKELGDVDKRVIARLGL